jgi:hypothetical protein
MPNKCFTCNAAESEGVKFSYCGACQSVLYCSKVCQKEDWKEGEHKKICKSLKNAGDGAIHVRRPGHERNATEQEEEFREMEHSFDEDMKRFFKLFKESTFEGSKAAAENMKKIAARQTKCNQKVLWFRSLYLLYHKDSEKLLWPNSPLLVLLHFVDPNVSPGNEYDVSQEVDTRGTLLHDLAFLINRRDYSTNENQLILARQLIEHGANVEFAAYPHGETPLHCACHTNTTTNLDFIELLLEKGANPNAQDQQGMTPLMFTTPNAPGAAKFLLEWPSTDANITTSSGVSFLAAVRDAVEDLSDEVALQDIADRAQHHLLIQQWYEIEEILVARQAVDTGIIAVE